MLNLLTTQIVDTYVRENFQRIIDFFRKTPVLENFQLVTFTATGATTVKIAHKLGYVPKDVIQLRKVGAGAVTWDYESFDIDYVYATVTGACEVRAFVGTYTG